MPTIPCNNYIVPLFQTDECIGERKPASCVIDSSIYTELGLEADATQQQINQALYLSAIASKSITDGLQTQIDLVDSYSQKVILLTEGTYTLIVSDNNKGLILENLDEEEALEVIISLPLGVADGFKTKILKKQSGTVRILPEINILRPNNSSNEIGYTNDWVYIEKLDGTDTFIINGGLGLAV